MPVGYERFSRSPRRQSMPSVTRGGPRAGFRPPRKRAVPGSVRRRVRSRAAPRRCAGPASGGGRRCVDRRRRHPDRVRDQRHRAGGGMRQLDAHAAREHLRVVEDLVEVVDRPARHVGRFERGDPFGRACASPSRWRSSGTSVARLRDPQRVGREARVGGPLRPAGDGAEAARTGRRCRPRGSCRRRRSESPGTARCSGARCRRRRGTLPPAR